MPLVPPGRRFYSQAMRRALALAAACTFLVTACTAGHSRPAADSQTSPGSGAAPSPSGPAPVPGATYAAGGCGRTPLLLGAAPGWAASANPPPIRYALADRGEVAGFLFGYPLVAPASATESDKVLWVVDSVRAGPLRVTGHPLGAARPVVSSSWPANSEPGEIYPSLISVPSPGCWRFTLAWPGHTDTVDLRCVSRR